MCLRALFSPAEQDAAQIEWALVTELERAVGDGWRYADSSRRLRHLIRQARERADSPQAWARAFAQALLDTLEAAQEAEAAQSEIELLKLRLASFRRIVAEVNANPLNAQVEALTQERDRWQKEATQHADRIRSLEATLARSQQMHRQEVAQLRQEVAALNRLVVEQQEELVQRNS
jgi:predicted RNase H-like nuclease (RuvC/YqgF family)